ncbi:MAG: hypothetical protein GX957_05765 [Clostridiaceae bacterium]|nr:hypothetical protein [Clostridiaceae bacterium]
MKSFLKSQNGFAMVFAIVLILVAALLCTALFAYSSTNHFRYLSNKDYKMAEYLARTGIEVTIKAWEAVVTNTLVPRETMPVYMLKDGTFYTLDEGEDPPEDSIGYYTVKVDPNGIKNLDGNEVRVIYFYSTAKVGKETATATAYTVMSLNAYEQGWYDINGTPSEMGMTTLDSSVIHSSLWWGTSSANVKGHIFPGNISFPATGNPDTVFSLNDNQKIAYAGKSLYFDLPIRLKKDTSSRFVKNVLVLSGGDIVINGDVELYAYYGLLGSGIGTLVLSVLEDYEYDDPVTPEKYKCGKVYFGGDVYITIQRLLGSSKVKLFSKGDVYYFKGNEGLDLVKYYVDNYGSGSFLHEVISSIYPSKTEYDKTYMRRIDPEKYPNDEPADLIPPPRDETGVIVWE